MYDMKFRSEVPDPPESSATITDTFIRMFLTLMVSALPAAYSSLATPQPKYQANDAILAAICGSIALAWFARKEDLPTLAGVIAGPVSGCGIYFATMTANLELPLISRGILLFCGLFGALPGLILFYILTKIYYALFDSVGQSPSDNDCQNDLA